MSELEDKLLLHFLVLKHEVDTEILRRKYQVENRGGQHVAMTSSMITWSLSSLLHVQRSCKDALVETSIKNIEDIRKKYNL